MAGSLPKCQLNQLVMTDPSLRSLDQARLFAVILNRSMPNRGGWCQIDQASLACELGVSRRRVCQLIKGLAPWVEIRPGRGRGGKTGYRPRYELLDQAENAHQDAPFSDQKKAHCGARFSEQKEHEKAQENAHYSAPQTLKREKITNTSPPSPPAEAVGNDEGTDFDSDQRGKGLAPMPEHDFPSDRILQDLRAEGLQPDQVEPLVRRFQNAHGDRQSRDWNAKFYRWACRQLTPQSNLASNVVPISGAATQAKVAPSIDPDLLGPDGQIVPGRFQAKRRIMDRLKRHGIAEGSAAYAATQRHMAMIVDLECKRAGDGVEVIRDLKDDPGCLDRQKLEAV